MSSSSSPSKKRKADDADLDASEGHASPGEADLHDKKEQKASSNSVIKIVTMFGNGVILRKYDPDLALARVRDIASAMVAMELEQTGKGTYKATAELLCRNKLVDTSLRASDFPAWTGCETTLYARWDKTAFSDEQLALGGLHAWIVLP
jgi:hypothetical protein